MWIFPDINPKGKQTPPEWFHGEEEDYDDDDYDDDGEYDDSF